MCSDSPCVLLFIFPGSVDAKQIVEVTIYFEQFISFNELTKRCSPDTAESPILVMAITETNVER